MDWVFFFYYLGHLLTRLLLIFTFVNLMICGNVLLLRLTFWLLRKKSEKKHCKTIVDDSLKAEAEFVDANTGKKEKWKKKTIWVRKD